MEEYYQSCFGHMDPLSSSSSLSPSHVSVTPSELLFNHKISSFFSTSSTSSQPVSITNHTRGKLRYACLPLPTVASHYGTTYFVLFFLLSLVSVACGSAPDWCGPLPKNPRSLSLPHHVTWLHWSPPLSEWPMTPSSSILCTEHNLSALHAIM